MLEIGVRAVYGSLRFTMYQQILWRSCNYLFNFFGVDLPLARRDATITENEFHLSILYLDYIQAERLVKHYKVNA